MTFHNWGSVSACPRHQGGNGLGKFTQERNERREKSDLLKNELMAARPQDGLGKWAGVEGCGLRCWTRRQEMK